MPDQEGTLAGPRKPNERDAVANFFGDDDDFFNDDADSVDESSEPAPPALIAEEEPVAAPQVTEPVVETPVVVAPEPVVEAAPEPVVEPAPEPVVEAAPEPAAEAAPEPAAEAAPEPAAEAAPEPAVEAAPEPAAEAAPEPAVEAAPVVEAVAEAVVAVPVAAAPNAPAPRLPPPPPRYVAPGRPAGGYLDSILPQTLDGPRPASASPQLTGAPEHVDSVDGDSAVPRSEFLLPVGLDAWREALAAIEAAANEEGAARADLLVQAAHLRLRALGDASGARERLAAALAEGASGDEVLVLSTDLSDASNGYEAWATRAGALTGAAAADAWRRAAAASTDPATVRAALHEAVAADPSDLDSLDRLIDALHRLGDDEALVGALEIRALVDDASAVASLHTERGNALARLGRMDEAITAWSDALTLDPEQGDADVSLEAALRAGAQYAALAERYLARGGPTALWLAARALRSAGDDGAAASFATASAVSTFAAIEREAWLLTAGQPDDLVAAIEQIWGERTGIEAAAAFYRLGAALERLGGASEQVLAAYRKSSALGFGLATDAVERALRSGSDHEALIAFHTERVKSWDVPRLVDLVGLADARDAAAPADAETVAAWRVVADRGDLAGLRGLRRAATAAGSVAERVFAAERLAALESDPTVAAARAFEAASLHLVEGDPATAASWFEKALAVPTGDLLAFEGLIASLVGAGRASEAADRLESRAATSEGERAESLLLEAARLREGVSADSAIATLDRLLAITPDHAEATRRLAQVAGARRPDVIRAALKSPGSVEARLADATLAMLAGGPLPEESFEGLSTLRALAVASSVDTLAWGDRVAADGLGDAVSLEAFVVLAGMADAGRVVAALEAAPQGVGTPTLVRQAESLGRTDLALRFAVEAGLPASEIDRLTLASSSGAAEALVGLRGALDRADAPVATLARLAQIAGAAGDADVQVRSHELVVERTSVGSVQALHASWLGSLRHAAGDAVGALSAWRLALAGRPGSIAALDGAKAAAAAAKDVESATELARAEGPRAVAEAVEAAGGSPPVEAWREAAASGQLLDAFGLERALVEAGDWQGVFDAWTARLATTTAESERARLEIKRRWVLAEKLAEADLAWELYQKLHEDAPGDRDVLESLARIAGRRGEVAQAIQYLTDLARTAPTPKDAARYHRRIAEVCLANGQDAEARQALFDALDVSPEDLEALAGLRDLADRTGDFDTLHAVLKREVVLVPAVRRVVLLRQIADVAQHKLADPGRAIDAWRQVLVEVPGDRESLRSLFTLADEGDDLGLYIESGTALAESSSGAERSALLSVIGVRCDAAGRTDDAVHYLEQAISAEVPDAGAAQKLEAIYRHSGDHAGVVRALSVQAECASDVDAKVAKLLAAARVELESRHDREAAHRTYERVLLVSAEQPDALRFESTYLYDAGRHAEALDLYARLEPLQISAADDDDDDVRMEATAFFYRFAEMLRGEGRAAEAVARYERALQLNPSHLPTLEAVGPLYVAVENWTVAGDVYQRLLNLTGGQGDPEQVANIYTMLGRVDRHHGKPDKALKRFTKALEAFPNFVPALKGLAGVHEDRHDWQNLLTAYNGVIYNASVQKDVIDAYMTKGRVLDDELGRPDKAAQHYERCLAFDAAQPVAYLRLSELALRRQAWEEAAEIASRGLGFVGDDVNTHVDLKLALCMARLMVDDAVGAADALSKAQSLSPELVAVLGAAPLADPAAIGSTLRARLPK